MPIRLPRGNRSSSLLFTVVGLTGLPTIRRAEVRLSTGCRSSPTRTYSAAVDRSASTALVPADAFGRISENTKQPARPVTRMRPPISTARDWVRSGSTSILVSCRAIPEAIRAHHEAPSGHLVAGDESTAIDDLVGAVVDRRSRRERTPFPGPFAVRLVAGHAGTEQAKATQQRLHRVTDVPIGDRHELVVAELTGSRVF